MILWEYRTLPVQWDHKARNWVGMVPQASGMEPVVGWEAILGLYGAAGWELVTVLPTGMLYASSLQSTLAFFKRPVRDAGR